jgi:adenosine kinase
VELETIDKSKIVDTNGAGDSFVGAFMAAVVQGKSIVEAVRAGNRLAGIVITKSGCTFE